MSAADTLDAVALDESGVVASLHVTGPWATLELFAPDGRLMHVATVTSVDATEVRGAWVVATPRRGRVLIALGNVELGTPLPLIWYWHGRRQVRGRLHRLGSFWLSEAVGGRLRLDVDDGVHATVVKSRWRPGAVRLRGARTRLTNSLRPTLESS